MDIGMLTLRRWMTFNGVGLVGAAVQLSVLALLTHQFGLSAAWATPLAVEAAILHNFAWHSRVTWRGHVAGSETVRRLLQFHALNGLVSLAGNAAITVVLTTRGLNVLAANVVAILACATVNFVLGDRIIFRKAAAATLCFCAWHGFASAPVLAAADESRDVAFISGPSPAALAGWNAYVSTVERRYDAATSANFFLLDIRRRANWRDSAMKGTVPMLAATPADAPDAKIHHWAGAIYIPNTTVQAVVKRMQDYAGRESEFYQEVKTSKLLQRNGGQSQLFMRLQRDAGVVSAEYNTEHAVSYRTLDTTRAMSRSTATKIAEIEHAGTPQERELAPGQDRGFLWRLNAYWRFEQSASGVFIECESVSLSRAVPWLIRPIASPIVTRIARESLERTLRSLRAFLTGAS
jgi:putative flippase GtrA